MGNLFFTFRKGTKVLANYNGEAFVLEFCDKHAARSFIEELHAAQYDLTINGRDNAKRKKSMTCSAPDKTVTVDFHLERKKEREPIVVHLSSEEETTRFHELLSKAVFGEKSHESDDL